MTNRQLLEQEANKHDWTVGCYSPDIDKLNKTNLAKVIKRILWEADTKVFINRRPHIVQIDIVEGEVDLIMISLEKYNSMNDPWDDDMKM